MLTRPDGPVGFTLLEVGFVRTAAVLCTEVYREMHSMEVLKVPHKYETFKAQKVHRCLILGSRSYIDHQHRAFPSSFAAHLLTQRFWWSRRLVVKFQTLEQVLNPAQGAKKGGNSERWTGSNTQVDSGSDAKWRPLSWEDALADH